MAAPMRQFTRVFPSMLKIASSRTSSQRFKSGVFLFATKATTRLHDGGPRCTSCWGNHFTQQRRTFFGLFKKKLPTQPKPKKEDLPYRVVLPGNVSPVRTVPDHVPKPEYASSGVPSAIYRLPILLNLGEMEKMREAGAMARRILDIGASHIKPGVTTDFIDEMIHAACLENNVYPSTLNYKGFPKSVCTSVNNVLVHGIPDDRPLEEGDIVNIDFTVFMNGYHGDVSETYTVGSVDVDGRHLINTARLCRDEAIRMCGPQEPIANIGIAVQSIAQSEGFYVCPSFVGHGIGKQFHCKPDIWHYANSYPERMLPGMAFTIEPVILERQDSVTVADDGWTVLAERHTRSAQFEHTVLITQSGVEVLTASPNEPFEMRDTDGGYPMSSSSSVTSSELHQKSSPSSDEDPTSPDTPKNTKKGDWTFD